MQLESGILVDGYYQNREKVLFEPVHAIFNNVAFFTSVDSDKPLQPPFRLRNSKWYSVSSFTIIEYSSD